MKGVIFDFNGTMVWDVNYQKKAWKGLYKLISGNDLSEIELEKNFYGVNNYISIKKHLVPNASTNEVNNYSILKEKMYRQEICQNPLEFKMAKGLEELLDYLKANEISINIASASIKENIDFFVERFELYKWFKVDNIIFDDGTYKNKIEMYKKAATKINKNIEDVVIFEDSDTGLKEAKLSGCKTIVAVDLGNNPIKYRDCKCQQVIKDFTTFDKSLLI